MVYEDEEPDARDPNYDEAKQVCADWVTAGAQFCTVSLNDIQATMF